MGEEGRELGRIVLSDLQPKVRTPTLSLIKKKKTDKTVAGLLIRHGEREAVGAVIRNAGVVRQAIQGSFLSSFEGQDGISDWGEWIDLRPKHVPFPDGLQQLFQEHTTILHRRQSAGQVLRERWEGLEPLWLGEQSAVHLRQAFGYPG